MGYISQLAPSHRQDSSYHGLCYTSRGALVGRRNNSNGSTMSRSIAPWARVLLYAPSHRQDSTYHGVCLHQSWSTGWNEKWLNGSTMRDRSDDPSHHDGTNKTCRLTKHADKVSRTLLTWTSLYFSSHSPYRNLVVLGLMKAIQICC